MGKRAEKKAMNDAVRNAAVPPIPRRLKRQRFESEPLKEIEGSDRFKKQSEKETETACTQREIISKPEDAPCPQILRPLPCSPSRQIIAKKSCIASNSMSEIGSCAKVALPSISFSKKSHLYSSTISSLPGTSSESPNSSSSFLYSFSMMLQNTSKANDLRQKVENLSSKGCEIMGSPSHYRKRVQLMPPPLPSKSMNGDYYVKRCTTFLSRNIQETPVTPVSSGPTKRSREETSLIGNQSSKGYEITGSPSQSKKKEQLLTSRLPSKNLNRNYCMEKSTQGHIRNVDETCETALASTSTEHTKVHHEELTTKTSSLGPADAPSEKTENTSFWWNECQNLVYLYKRGAKIFTLDNIPAEELWYKEAFVAQKNLIGRSSAEAHHNCGNTNTTTLPFF